jgi:hypothetical protein
VLVVSTRGGVLRTGIFAGASCAKTAGTNADANSAAVAEARTA